MKEILNCIKSYADFPNKGIIFQDLLGLLQEPDIFKALINNMASSQIVQDSDAILAIEARGFIFGSAIALQSGKPMIVARKPKKLPGELLKKEYKLEYGTDTLAIQKDSIKRFQKFIVVDDVLATGGTARCASDILISNGKVIVGYNMVIEIKSLKGRRNLNAPVQSQLII